MSLDMLIEMCKARLTQLSQLRTSAFALGDAQQVTRIDAESDETQVTINRLLTLI
jgi:hypothetical protein